MSPYPDHRRLPDVLQEAVEHGKPLTTAPAVIRHRARHGHPSQRPSLRATGPSSALRFMLGNVEASVRSRDERHLTAGGGRDLIEAVLN